MSYPIVAIVGEPNAGKSTLLNKIAGKRLAVTSKVAGTTRDRQYADIDWNGKHFTLVDTAGITFAKAGELEMAMDDQIKVALDQADAILYVVDGKLTPESNQRKVFTSFRKIKKPVFLVVNKLDSPKTFESITATFAKLGIKNLHGVSAQTGRGLGDLLDDLAASLPKVESAVEPTGIAVAIVGKPNVGKSSLLNKILGENRVVVSPVPGTTRTSIHTHATIDGVDYTFIDTAGIKRKQKQSDEPDIFSGFQTMRNIRLADVVLVVVDAVQEITTQDQRMVTNALDEGRGVILVANKMDEYIGEEKALRDYLSHHFPALWFSPVYFVSAKTGENVKELLTAIKPIYDARNKIAPQETLDQILAYAMKKSPPMLLRDQKKPKVYGLRQFATNPPGFELTVNHPAAISMQFRNSLKNKILRDLNFWGSPIGLKLKAKDKIS